MMMTKLIVFFVNCFLLSESTNMMSRRRIVTPSGGPSVPQIPISPPITTTTPASPTTPLQILNNTNSTTDSSLIEGEPLSTLAPITPSKLPFPQVPPTSAKADEENAVDGENPDLNVGELGMEQERAYNSTIEEIIGSMARQVEDVETSEISPEMFNTTKIIRKSVTTMKEENNTVEEHYEYIPPVDVPNP